MVLFNVVHVQVMGTAKGFLVLMNNDISNSNLVESFPSFALVVTDRSLSNFHVFLVSFADKLLIPKDNMT